jgi:hypothetical protein
LGFFLLWGYPQMVFTPPPPPPTVQGPEYQYLSKYLLVNKLILRFKKNCFWILWLVSVIELTRCRLSDLNLSDTKLFRCWTYQIPNLSDNELIRYWPYQIPNLSDTGHIINWAHHIRPYHIPNLSDSKIIRYRTYQIPNISDPNLSDTRLIR